MSFIFTSMTSSVTHLDALPVPAIQCMTSLRIVWYLCHSAATYRLKNSSNYSFKIASTPTPTLTPPHPYHSLRHREELSRRRACAETLLAVLARDRLLPSFTSNRTARQSGQVSAVCYHLVTSCSSNQHFLSWHLRAIRFTLWSLGRTAAHCLYN